MVTNSINDFISYGILGIKEFTNKIDYLTLINSDKLEIKILAFVIPITIIIMAITIIILKLLKKENQETKNILTILAYSLSIIIVMYPIADEIHFLIGSTITIIGASYCIFLITKVIYNKIKLKKKKKIYQIIISIICIILFFLILKQTVNNMYKYGKIEKNTEISHYKNIEIGQVLKERIKIIDDYILKKEDEGKKVYILDSEASFYMIPLNKYNKNYDMFLKGNIGKTGELGEIEKIKQKDVNTIYLIRKKQISLNWQSPKEVIEYVRNNLKYIGEISIYEIYE